MSTCGKLRGKLTSSTSLVEGWKRGVGSFHQLMFFTFSQSRKPVYPIIFSLPKLIHAGLQKQNAFEVTKHTLYLASQPVTVSSIFSKWTLSYHLTPRGHKFLSVLCTIFTLTVIQYKGALPVGENLTDKFWMFTV